MQVSVNDIKVKKRVRKDLGDLDDLKFSMNRYGLLNPITINSNFELVAGERRLEAAKALGWTEIEAIMIDTKDKLTLLEIELEENNQRKPFTDEELMKGLETLRKLRNPHFFTELKLKLIEFFQRHFDAREERKKEKRVQNFWHSFLLLLGIALITVGSILAKKEIINFGWHTAMDIVGCIFCVCGVFYLIKFIIGVKNK